MFQLLSMKIAHLSEVYDLRKVKLSHNLGDEELEEVLEKALQGLRKSEDVDSPYPDKHADLLREEAYEIFEKLSTNMLKEIENVLKEG